MLVLAAALFQIAPTQAQTVPTATPTDPLWIAFSKTRDALEEQIPRRSDDCPQLAVHGNSRSTGGIDRLREAIDPSQAHQLFYGWRFVITALDGRQFEGRSSFDCDDHHRL